MSEVARDLVRQLRRETWRVVLMLLGIAIGASTVVFLASTLHAANYALNRASQDASGSGITHVEERRPPPGTSRFAPGLSDRDAVAMAAHEGASDDSVVGASSLYGREANVGAKRMRIGVQSGGTTYAKIAGFELTHGRWPLETEDGTRVCVIGADVHQKLFGGAWPLPHDGSGRDGLVVDGGTRLAVVGVLKAKPPMGGGGGDGTWQVDRRIVVSHATFKRALAQANEYDEIAIKTPRAEQGVDAKTIANGLMPLLLNLHQGVKNFEFDALTRGADMDVIINLALLVILVGCGAVATIVGGVNVMNAQFVVVSERTREYGIRRAIGVSARRLRAMVLVETVALTSFGSVVGVGAGVALAKGMSLLLSAIVTPWPFYIAGWSLAASLIGSAVAGFCAGWLPAKRAGNLSVVACLRGD